MLGTVLLIPQVHKNKNMIKLPFLSGSFFVEKDSFEAFTFGLFCGILDKILIEEVLV